jgi:general stress protein YciG
VRITARAGAARDVAVPLDMVDAAEAPGVQAYVRAHAPAFAVGAGGPPSPPPVAAARAAAVGPSPRRPASWQQAVEEAGSESDDDDFDPDASSASPEDGGASGSSESSDPESTGSAGDRRGGSRGGTAPAPLWRRFRAKSRPADPAGDAAEAIQLGLASEATEAGGDSAASDGEASSGWRSDAPAPRPSRAAAVPENGEPGVRVAVDAETAGAVG